jgi:hypothetical protein
MRAGNNPFCFIKAGGFYFFHFGGNAAGKFFVHTAGLGKYSEATEKDSPAVHSTFRHIHEILMPL